MDTFVKKSISDLLAKGLEPSALMDELLERFKMHYGRPVSSMAEIKLRENRKIKGDVLESFCQIYFKTVLTKKETPYYTNVWLLNEVPPETRKLIGLPKQDFGIDIILLDIKGEYHAVQVKYRQHPRSKTKNVIGWKQLSTFYSLVNRSGGPNGYAKHIVFTNADYVRHVGKKDPKDRTYAIGTLRKIKKDHWLRMAGIKGLKLDSDAKKLSIEEIRAARLKAFAV